jgi:zona occludens toxin (predicted ATPase)
MIYFYSGTPGSGKSYHVAKDIYFQLNRGKNVIANFDINYDMIKAKKRGYFFYKDNFDLEVDWLLDFSRLCHRRDKRGKIIEGQTWLIIDECQLTFNCRSWNDKSRQQWTSFFTQHRKYGYHIILISQFDRLIDRQIRSLIEYEYRHRKINNFGTVGFFLGLFSLGHPLFISVEYWYGVKEKCGVSFFYGRKKYYRMYDSYKLFDEGTQGG